MKTLPLRRGLLACSSAPLLAVCFAQPALADHAIAGGGVSGSGPIITIAAETLPVGKVSIGVEAGVAVPDAYSDAQLIAFAARHVHAHTTDYTLQSGAAISYGIIPHLTVSARLPLIRRDDLREGHHSHAGGGVSNTVEQLGSPAGIGDLALLAQYQVAHDHQAKWFVAALGGIKVPTGSTHRRTPDGERLETEHQPGTGSWDPLFGLAASKGWGPWSLHASALYHLATKGAQDTRLGDRVGLNGAVVYRLGGDHDHHHDGTEPEHDAAANWAVMLEAGYEREGRQTIAGAIDPDSGAKVLWVSPGVRFSARSGWSAALSVGVPAWQDVGISHPDNAVRVVAQIGVGF